MPLKVPDDLPACAILSREGVRLIEETDALRQDIRALRILFVNLMPDKISTETQFARLLGNTPLQVEVVLLRMESYASKNVSRRHLLDFYRDFSDVCDEYFDGLLVTGAPVEHLDFSSVAYWHELQRIMDWSCDHILGGSLYVCWSAQAALYHRYKVAKHALREKLFGLFPHRRLRASSSLLAGFGESPFAVPVSRWTETRQSDLPGDLEVLIDSDEAGLCLVEDLRYRSLYMFNHLEYDADTLAREYQRDLGKDSLKDSLKDSVAAGCGVVPDAASVGISSSGISSIKMPRGYFPADNPSAAVSNSWRPYAQLLFSNWIGQIYERISLRNSK